MNDLFLVLIFLRKRFTDLEGFLDEDYDGEHHMLWDNQEECWICLDDVLCLMEKEYVNIKEENEKLRAKIEEQQSNINKKKELLKLIANACSFNKEHSVKEILRNEIKGIDTVTYESANAWHDYVLLCEFFEECYGEHWDNE